MPKRDDTYLCDACGLEVGDVVAATIEGKNFHIPCYVRPHPPKLATCIHDVIYSEYDPSLARHLLELYLSNSSVQHQIIKDYNEQVAEMHRRRCQE